jgi:hypothetical protein
MGTAKYTKINAKTALFIDEFAYDVPGMLKTLHIGFVGVTNFSPKVAKQIK